MPSASPDMVIQVLYPTFLHIMDSPSDTVAATSRVHEDLVRLHESARNKSRVAAALERDWLIARRHEARSIRPVQCGYARLFSVN